MNSTADIRIITTEGELLHEPALVAYDKNTDKILAIGNDARDAKQKFPLMDVEEMSPFKYGKVANFVVAEKVMRYFMKKAGIDKRKYRKKPFLIVPDACTEVEKKAFSDMMYQCKVRQLIICEEHFAAGKMDAILKEASAVIVIGKDDSIAYVNEKAEELKQYAAAKGIDNTKLKNLF